MGREIEIEEERKEDERAGKIKFLSGSLMQKVQTVP